MSKIFLIAGLGADTRIYNNIDLHEHDVTPVDWIEPNVHDTLTTYAQKLIHQYHISKNAVVIGNSLGGMLAIEIGKLIPLNKIILISSIKTIDEAPWYFGLLKKIPLYKIVPKSLYNSLGFMMELIFGKMDPEDKWLFKDMLKNSSPQFLNWAMNAALKWDNKLSLSNVYHIIGDNDAVFSHNRIKGATVVKGGTHIMLFDRPKQINKLLKAILKKK